MVTLLRVDAQAIVRRLFESLRVQRRVRVGIAAAGVDEITKLPGVAVGIMRRIDPRHQRPVGGPIPVRPLPLPSRVRSRPLSLIPFV